MAKQLLQAKGWSRACLGLALAATSLSLAAQMPRGVFFSFRHHKPPADKTPDSRPAEHASQPAEFVIPVEPLGFYPPGAYYQGLRVSLVSLDFLDENRLLFTFRTPGLLRRDPGDGDERQIRALVLTLPDGNVQSEALWTLHDEQRYLWMLKDGHFLLRDLDTLKEGDASLELRPMLHFPGRVLWMEMDPTQKFLVADSKEPLAAKPQPGDVSSPATAKADITTEDQVYTGQPDIVVRVLHRATGQVMLVSRVRSLLHLPINSDGYLEMLRSTGDNWLLNLNYFTGGSTILGTVKSACAPPVEFINQQEALATTCNQNGGRWLVAISTSGHRLWDVASPPTQIWPRLVVAPNGLRLARETLVISHPVDAYSPISFDDIKTQNVEVYDAASGKRVLTADANPILDGGGNVALSPSGKRVAVLDSGNIRVYELPPPPAMTEPAPKRTAP
jgi:hypothetical protein